MVNILHFVFIPLVYNLNFNHLNYRTMKKIILSITAVFILFGAFHSCTKSLDIPNPNTVDETNYWKTADDALAGVNAVYGNNYRNGLYARWLAVLLNPRSDDGIGSSGWDQIFTICNFKLVNYNAEPLFNAWAHFYRGVYRANQVITNVPNITMDETLKKRYIAEAKFWRAAYYANLTLIWGDVPLVLEPSKPADLPAKTASADVYAQLIKDLQEAIPDLPVTYDNNNTGRITKGAAYALMGKSFLQQNKHAEALPAFEWLVEGEGKNIYSLVANYADNFSPNTENNKESILEIQFKAQQSVTDEDDPNSNMGNQREPFFAPGPPGFNDLEMHRWVVDEFLKEKTLDGKRDPRLAETAIFDYTDERGPDFSFFWGKTFSDLLSPGDKRVWYRKYENDRTSTGITFEGEKNVRVIRYADVLLMYAECLNETGQTAKAYQYVDMVRQRAGLAKLADTKPGMNKEDFLKQLMHERVMELTGEDVRWGDLARWGYFDNEQKLAELKARDFEFDNFKIGRNKFLPIPQSEIDINPNLVQNADY